MSTSVYVKKFGKNEIAVHQREFDGIENARHYCVARLESRREALKLRDDLDALIAEVFPPELEKPAPLWQWACSNEG